MSDHVLWKKLNEQLDAEYIDQLDKNFITQNSSYFESNFALIRGLDLGFAYPPVKRKPVSRLDGLSPVGKNKYIELKSQFER